MFRQFRILLLLLLLFGVAASAWLTKLRVTDWSRSQWVAVYPINGDGRAATADYIRGLDPATFASIGEFLTREAAQYGLSNRQPVELKLAPAIAALPPAPPPRGQALQIAWWSLKLRWWMWRNDSFNGPATMRLLVIYHDPETSQRVDHSLGLEKGLIGIVHAFAEQRMAEQNNVVIAHELLHLVGATDKYDLATNQPIYPVGYAEPGREPLHPQRFAEIMGGRIAVSPSEAEVPRHLRGVMVGPQTAREIRWIE